MEAAKKGVITPEMELVAKKEFIEPEKMCIRDRTEYHPLILYRLHECGRSGTLPRTARRYGNHIINEFYYKEVFIMKTKAVRIYGENDLRLEEFELPSLGQDEILLKVVSDSICMSSYKAAIQGAAHKRVPNNVAETPTIIGHEFCGEIVEVGEKWKAQYKVGQRVSIQPALNDPSDIYAAPGYSFPYIGGDATYVIVPNRVMELGCLLSYTGDAFFYGSLSEPVACVIGGFHTSWHNIPGHYAHKMDIVPGGKMAILAGAGPMERRRHHPVVERDEGGVLPQDVPRNEPLGHRSAQIPARRCRGKFIKMSTILCQQNIFAVKNIVINIILYSIRSVIRILTFSPQISCDGLS